MNLVLAKVGYAGTHSDAAKSFAEYGHRVSEPEVGAIAVLTRGKTGGHVGVVSGIDKSGNPIIISGNHGHRVGEAIYPRTAVIAYVMPSNSGFDTTQLAARSQPANQPAGQPNRSASPERPFESPIAELLAAIEAEQKRSERPSQPAPQAQPAEPRRIVQQTPEPVPQAAPRAGADNPAIAELFGLKSRAQVAPPPRPAPQRERQVQQIQSNRVARSDSGLSGAFSLR
jgi:surface antigen